MKKLILTFALLSTTQVLHAKCNKLGIGYRQESGFSLDFTFGSGGNSLDSAGYYDKNTVNVPLSINDTMACYKQKSAIGIKSEKKGEGPLENAVAITPLKVEFENVPNPHQKQYIYIEKGAGPSETRFQMLTFVCSGEIPLSISAVNSTAAEIAKSSEKISMTVRHEFAAGVAAANLTDSFAEKFASIATYDFFSNLYKTKTVKEISDCPSCNTNSISIPSI
ncbi:MAG: hypothetical protein K2Q18_14810, partial [Bdellovibrionales bacterium]|nr:hypothetical protein [Bdellovibrionales bacterium]